ncbi:transcriptional regulator [Amycolatopsis mediterranei S699]|uniref:Transcriptional regulator n=2 Tax=Amycolatopsis mediterranei TaxID=33910 RepID=A0A9R0P2R7_AMYMS|nr:helix-turn-helix domain-containing protein [Amycolatopsis mediterranei]ADJ48219.1 putative transcriptional regulator [Amycolatopsis mediterranei U32]AEK45126.1 transcriptional regulator [Amycolatopsis mediterranei S699]AFO79930.1 transcriptional regulator [Amycolatopsis mediterranei S699]AGT87058.1 transcriptional regulator [Amycolatopsis mediterranei RB]KDO10705.1 transcriptional regulator [Amycolatopsis mediterranei]
MATSTRLAGALPYLPLVDEPCTHPRHRGQRCSIGNRDRVSRPAPAGIDVANQETVNALYGLLRGSAVHPADRSRLPATMAQVLAQVRTAAEALSATDVAEQLGVSRATAQRYLADLVRRGLLDLSLNYGTAGRPEHRYHVPRR